MPKTTGIVKIHIDGKLVRSKDGATLETGGMERTLHVGHGVVYGASEKFKPSLLECTLVHMADTDVIALNKLAGVVARFESDVGTTYLLNNMYTTEPCKVSGGEGEVSLKMSGDAAIEE